MTGPSSVTTLTGKGDVYFENGGDALCIGTLGNDSRTFYMDLDGDDGVSSDMLYIGEENIKALNDDIRTFLRGEDPSKAVSKS